MFKGCLRARCPPGTPYNTLAEFINASVLLETETGLSAFWVKRVFNGFQERLDVGFEGLNVALRVRVW